MFIFCYITYTLAWAINLDLPTRSDYSKITIRSMFLGEYEYSADLNYMYLL